MYRMCIGLISLVLVLAASASTQAATFSDSFDTPFDYLTEGAGAYSGMVTDGVSALNASITQAGVLYFESVGGVWDPGPGPLLYVEVSGDFVATVKVADYAGTADAYVYYNNCGLMARALPADGGDGEDWIAIDYFPLYGVGNIVRYADDGVRYEDVGGNGAAFNADTYLQIERVGNTFYLRTSPDGENWVDYPDAGFSPLERPDLDGVPVQVGLAQCTYTANVGYAAFDDFSIVTPGPKVVWVSARHPSSADANVPSDAGFVALLEEAGYDVDYTAGSVAGTSYWETLDANQMAVLEAADLVIIGRDCNSSGVSSDANEIAFWNGLKTPVMLMSSYIAGSNRWNWFNTTSQSARESYYDVKAVDPNGVLFAGVALDANDVAQWYDPNVASGYSSFILMADAGNGTALAVRPDNGNVLVVEWAKGKAFYEGSAQTPGGRRMFFNAGTQEISGLKTDWGVMNLNAEGQQIFLNAVAYMVTRNPILVSVENASFELPGTEKIKGWNGEGVSGTPAVDIPGWVCDTTVSDSGVESDTNYPASDGAWTAFLMGSDPSVWQLTDYVIDAEDVFEVLVDARDNWAATTLRIILFYDDEGARIPTTFVNVTLTSEMQTFSLEFNAADAPDAVGKCIGIELDNVTTAGSSWLGLDNVRLFDLEGR